MPIFSHPSGVPKPVVVDGVTYQKSDWMESGRDPEFSPTVFLVEQPPNVSLRTHFHRQNQFQLFVRGEGSMGPHRLGALTVHYAGAYSGYGPLVSGAGGLAYFTLRSVFETGSLTPVKDAAQMRRGPKRQLHSQPVMIADTASLAALAAPVVNDLIPLQVDAIAARLYTLAPGTRYTGLDPAGSAGQFYVVLAGSLSVQERRLHTWQSVFISPSENPLELMAGKEGLQAVCLQLPHKAQEYR